MRLVKCIFGKINHFIIDLICRLLVDSIGNTAWYALIRIPIHKVLTFFLHDVALLLGHCSSQEVTSSECITCQITHDLHNLLLIYDTAVSRRKDRLQLRAVIGNAFRVILAFDILRDEVHRTRTI